MGFLPMIGVTVLGVLFIVLILVMLLRRRTDKPVNIYNESLHSASPDTADNQRKILEMIQQGKIDIEEGKRLLETINQKAMLEHPLHKAVRRFRRSNNDRQLGGVCGGFGEYFDLDSTLVRLGYILVAIITGIIPMIIFYVIAVIVIPTDNR